jgi:hypothetical protein
LHPRLRCEEGMKLELPTAILNRLSEKFQELIHPNESPHCLPAIVDSRRIHRSSSDGVHLLGVCSVRVHPCLFCSSVHGAHLRVRHGGAARHEVDPFKNSGSSPFQTLKLYSLDVFAWRSNRKITLDCAKPPNTRWSIEPTCCFIFFHVYNVIWEFHTKPFFT